MKISEIINMQKISSFSSVSIKDRRTTIKQSVSKCTNDWRNISFKVHRRPVNISVSKQSCANIILLTKTSYKLAGAHLGDRVISHRRNSVRSHPFSCWKMLVFYKAVILGAGVGEIKMFSTHSLCLFQNV